MDIRRSTPPLPIEILVKIFDSVSFNDVIAAGTVCRDWKIGSEDNHLWFKHYTSLTGQDPTVVNETSPRTVFYKQKYIEHVKYLLGGSDINIMLNPTTVYANCMGKRISGLVIFKTNKDLVAKGVFLRLYCEEHSPFIREIYDYNESRYKHKKLESKPFNKIFNIKVHPHRSPITFANGLHRFKFDVPFPHCGEKGEYLSGSMQSESGLADCQTGSIIYGVEVFIEGENGSKKMHKSINIPVLPKYDVSSELRKSQPVTGSSDTYVLGIVHEYKLTASCPANVYLPGQRVLLDITVANLKSKPVKNLKISIRSCTICPTYYSATEEHVPHNAHFKKEVSWDIEFLVPAKDTRTQRVAVHIPKDFEQSIFYSNVIRKRHYLWIKLSKAIVKLPIVIVENVPLNFTT